MKKRIPNRLNKYDYSQPGYYFVTVCVRNKVNYFGEIKNRQMVLNEYGAVAAVYWQKISDYYCSVKLDEWAIMPNHIHGIIVLSGTEHCSVPTTKKSVSLSQIVKSFKDVTVKHIRSEFSDICFAWQRSFYDHIIRDESSLSRMREYIANNPAQWDLDIENTRIVRVKA